MSDENVFVGYEYAMPLNSKKFHIFHQARSLCGRWLFFGPGEQVTGRETKSSGDCAACVKRLHAQFKHVFSIGERS